MAVYRIGLVVLVGVVAVFACVFWPQKPAPDPEPNPMAAEYMLHVRQMEHEQLGTPAPPTPWWAATAPKSSAETRH